MLGYRVRPFCNYPLQIRLRPTARRMDHYIISPATSRLLSACEHGTCLWGITIHGIFIHHQSVSSGCHHFSSPQGDPISSPLCPRHFHWELFTLWKRENTKIFKLFYKEKYYTLPCFYRSLCTEDGLCYKHLKGNWCGYRNLFQSILEKINSSHAHV